MSKVTPFLMFNDQLEAAIAFYTATIPDSKVTRSSGGSAEFVIGGQRFMGYNGGSYFSFTDAFSLLVTCEDQKEVDDYWTKFVKAGAKEVQCGWLKDPFGVSWQIIPKRFFELMSDKDPKKVQAVVAAMMKMVKMDVAGLEKAYQGAT